MNILNRIINRIKFSLASDAQYIKMLRKEGVQIGDNCIISKSAYFGGEPWLIRIGNNTRITKEVSFITHDGGLWTLRKCGLIDPEAVKFGPIIIGDNCHIGWNVIIMPGVSIGNNCVIAAGAVVTKNVPDGSVWGGVPAKHIENIDEYFDKIKNQIVLAYSLNKEDKLKLLKKERGHFFL